MLSQVDTLPPLPKDRLPFQTLAAFALPSIGMGYMSFLVGTYYFKYCTDVLLVEPAIIGMILGLSRGLEGVLFPFIGYLSDRTRSRMGRRCSWLAASSLPA